MRAAPLLADTLRRDPKTTYERAKYWQSDAGGHLSRTDRPRVIAARLLADLVQMRPANTTAIRKAADAPMIAWLTRRGMPHANGMAYVAEAESPGARGLVRDWAFPSDPIPPAGAPPPFPRAFETAQTALRAVGRFHDTPSRPRLVEVLGRKPAKVDISQQALLGAGLAMQGMALRALAVGASDGLAHWGREAGPGAEDALVAVAEDVLWHEEARLAACEALAWVGSPKLLATLSERIAKHHDAKDPRARHAAV